MKQTTSLFLFGLIVSIIIFTFGTVSEPHRRTPTQILQDYNNRAVSNHEKLEVIMLKINPDSWYNKRESVDFCGRDYYEEQRLSDIQSSKIIFEAQIKAHHDSQVDVESWFKSTPVKVQVQAHPRENHWLIP